MAMPLVLLTHPLPPEWIAALDGRVRLIVGPAEPPGFAPHLLDQLPEAEGLITLLVDRVDDDLLSQAPRLRVVSNMAVGYDNIVVPASTARKIPVGNTPGVLTDATADVAMGLLLSAARRFTESALDAKEGRWSVWSPTGWLGADLNGATLGIVGMGKIGRAVTRRAVGFGLRIIYTDPASQPDIDEKYGARQVAFEALLEQSDFVSLHCPLQPATRGLINASALRAMKPSAVLINTARGPVVDAAALTRALTEGWIRSAALDVTDPEPLPPSHPLYQLKNCLIVPHIGSATHGTRRRMAELACENLLAGIEGRPLPHCVNAEVYK